MNLAGPPDPLNAPDVAVGASWMANGTWVFAEDATVVLEVAVALPFGGDRSPLVIRHATVTMRVAPDLSEATEGVIAGVITPLDLWKSVSTWALGRKQPMEMCGNENDYSIVEATADVSPGVSPDPQKQCTATSIAIGFHATRARLQGTAPPEPAELTCEVWYN